MNNQASLIDAIHALFRHLGMGRGAYEGSFYYSLCISSHPEALTDLGDEARKVDTHMTDARLKTGRQFLLRNGLLAQILFDYRRRGAVKREHAYLPAHPEAIWIEGKEKLREREPGAFQIRKAEVESLCEDYTKTFGKYGILIKEGKLSLLFSGMWVARNLLGLCRRKKENVFIWVSSKRIFGEPFLPYLHRILETDVNLKLLLTAKPNIERVKELKEKYKERIEIKSFPPEEIYGTSRRIIFGNELAIDARKILLPKTSEPSYLGTLYLEEENIETLRKSFDQDWRLGTAY